MQIRSCTQHPWALPCLCRRPLDLHIIPSPIPFHIHVLSILSLSLSACFLRPGGLSPRSPVWRGMLPQALWPPHAWTTSAASGGRAAQPGNAALSSRALLDASPACASRPQIRTLSQVQRLGRFLPSASHIALAQEDKCIAILRAQACTCRVSRGCSAEVEHQLGSPFCWRARCAGLHCALACAETSERQQFLCMEGCSRNE